MQSVRRVVTATDEQGNETAEYQLGGEVGGVFVPFVTKSEGYIDNLVRAERAAQERERDAGEGGGSARTPYRDAMAERLGDDAASHDPDPTPPPPLDPPPPNVGHSQGDPDAG